MEEEKFNTNPDDSVFELLVLGLAAIVIICFSAFFYERHTYTNNLKASEVVKNISDKKP